MIDRELEEARDATQVAITAAGPPSATATSKVSFCRFCHAFCGIKVDIEDGRVVKVVGDVNNPMYHGFTCVKGRALPAQHNHPDRLLHAMKRRDGGSFDPIPVQEAVDEIAGQLRDIIDEHGPRSIALYAGTYSFHYPVGSLVGRAFMSAIGSKMRFSSGSIDQPGKGVVRALHGTWSAGPQPFSDSDTWILVGANPLISMWGGIPQYDPAKRLREAKARGLKLIVIDPRRTETAANADLFLQPKPGEDPTILAGFLRVILAEGLHDADFVAADVEGLEALREAVEPFTPAYVEGRARVPAQLVVDAARLFASGRRGSVTAGTGPNMAPRGTLTEYLVACLQTVCGRWLRAGEPVPNPYVLLPQRASKAHADVRQPVWGDGERLRVRGLRDNLGGLPTAALADEILLDGPGQVRALICVGGNPLAAWPDQLKTLRALQSLELLVCVDMRMSATAKLADYAIGVKLGLEADGMTLPNETIWGYSPATTGYPEPYGQYAPAVVDPPEGSDVIEEWELLYRLAQQLGLQLEVAGVDVDMQEMPTTEALHRLMTRGSRIPLDEVMQHPSGHIFEDDSIVVQPKTPGWPHRLDVGNPAMMTELADVAAEPVLDQAGYHANETFTYRLVSRRLRDVYNSSGRDIPHLVRKHSYNPAYMNPADVGAEGFADGQVVEIDSGHARILGVVVSAPDVAPGVISMAHGWGDAPEHDAEVRTIGSNTGRLSSTDRDFDPITGMPMMSAVPVNVRAPTEVDESPRA